MNAAKAYAGGATAAATKVLMYFLDQLAFVAQMPVDVKLATEVLVSSAVVGLAVYLVPNRETRKDWTIP